MDLIEIPNLTSLFGSFEAVKEVSRAVAPRRAEGAPVQSPSRQRQRSAYLRQLLPFATLAVAGLLLAGATFAQAPPQGRYRCYQPPGYGVIAWFDLNPAGISIHGDAPQAIRIDAATGRIELPRDALPPYRHGVFFPPGASGGDAARVTIVLAGRADARPGRSGWATLPRCYLTTH